MAAKAPRRNCSHRSGSAVDPALLRGGQDKAVPRYVLVASRPDRAPANHARQRSCKPSDQHYPATGHQMPASYSGRSTASRAISAIPTIPNKKTAQNPLTDKSGGIGCDAPVISQPSQYAPPLEAARLTVLAATFLSGAVIPRLRHQLAPYLEPELLGTDAKCGTPDL